MAYPATSYTKNTELEPGAYYKFKVQGVNDIGEGAISEASVSIIAAQVTSEPLYLAKVSADQTHIAISWAPPDDDNGSPVTEYYVYMDGVLQ